MGNDGPNRQKINIFDDWDALAPSSVSLKKYDIKIKASANRSSWNFAVCLLSTHIYFYSSALCLAYAFLKLISNENI